jgi:mannitol/fructose-specific phosphotransferase system IIA component (Ntr-type)
MQMSITTPKIIKENENLKFLIKIQKLIENNDFLNSLTNRQDYKVIMEILNNEKLNLEEKQQKIIKLVFYANIIEVRFK